MLSERALRSGAQAYRWLIAGIAGAGVSQLLNNPSLLNPLAWLIDVLVLLFIFGLAWWGEYRIQGTIDPEYQ